MSGSESAWEAICSLYERPNLADAAIALQDQYDADVTLLLFAAWLALHGHRITAPMAAEMESAVADWRGVVVRAIRETRRAVRGRNAEEVYRQLKAVELAAERHELDLLFTAVHAYGETSRTAASVFDNVCAFMPKGAIGSEAEARFLASLPVSQTPHPADS